MWTEVLQRFEQQAPVSVMARVALEQALPAHWVDEVFEQHRGRQYRRELLTSTVVELMMLVCLGLRPSLHAAAKKMERLPVSIAALYDKVKGVEPNVLRALVQGSAQRLEPVMTAMAGTSSLAGWQVRILDGNHLPASEKRLAALREHAGAAMPGHSLVVYDPDTGLVRDLLACEDAHQSERVGAAILLEQSKSGQLWIADRHFCTRTLLQGWQETGAAFIIREHGTHPQLAQYGPWSDPVACQGGTVREQAIEMAPVKLSKTAKEKAQQEAAACAVITPWRRIELVLAEPTTSGHQSIVLWSNLPEHVDAATIAQLYRKRWTIEGLFGRLESVLQSEIRSLGHPKAALLGFSCAVLAYNVLELLKRSIEAAHKEQAPELDVSTYHLAVHIGSDYQGMLIATAEQVWQQWQEATPEELAKYLLELALRVTPKSVATAKRAPKKPSKKAYVTNKQIRQRVATARLLHK